MNNFICSRVFLPLRKNSLALCYTPPFNPHAAEVLLPEDQEALTACQAPYRTAKPSREGNTWRTGPLPHISPSFIAGGRRIQGRHSLFALFLSFLLSLSTQFPFCPWGKRGPSCQTGAAASWPGYPKGMSWDDEMYLFFFVYSPSTASGMKAPTRNGLPKPGTGSSPSFSGWASHPGVRDVDSSLMVLLELFALSGCLLGAVLPCVRKGSYCHVINRSKLLE